MPQISVTDLDGSHRLISAPEGVSAMEAMRAAGVSSIAAVCGGQCSCATCHVHVDPSWAARLPQPGEFEVELISFLDSYDPARSRLSCQIKMTAALDGLALDVAPS
jgi:2Fe-2S ferredoxin